MALLDFDNDGWLDIYLLNGSTLDAYKGKEPAPKAMLLHNNHDGTFTDVTEKAGVANERWGFVALLPTWPQKPASNLADGRRGRVGAITTMMAALTCSFPAMANSILITLKVAIFKESKFLAGHSALQVSTIIYFTTTETGPLQT